MRCPTRTHRASPGFPRLTTLNLKASIKGNPSAFLRWFSVASPIRPMRTSVCETSSLLLPVRAIGGSSDQAICYLISAGIPRGTFSRLFPF